MTQENITTKFKELLAHPEHLNAGNMESLVHETLQFFNTLQEQILSGDPGKQDAALTQALSLKEVLDEQLIHYQKTTGMDPSSLESYFNDPRHFSSEEWELLQKTREDLKEYQKEINNNISK
jgi:hypothetical protein